MYIFAIVVVDADDFEVVDAGVVGEVFDKAVGVCA